MTRRRRARRRFADEARQKALPAIGLHSPGPAGLLGLSTAAQGQAESLLRTAARTYSRPVLALGDRISRRWLEESANPYLAEIDQVARSFARPGAVFLNLNFEWGCSGAVAATPAGTNRLIRILDWPFKGLGDQVAAVRLEGPAGPWTTLTWPGFLGVIQGVAPGRFAAALHQAPLRHRSGVKPLDWAIGRRDVLRGCGLPPSHLLRRVFETARDYAAAREALIETRLALPAIFVLAGSKPGEGCIIERLETRALVHPAPASAANHWLDPQALGADPRDRPRGANSGGRRRHLATVSERLEEAQGELLPGTPEWFRPPVLNARTRLVLVADPATGEASARGYEGLTPATELLSLAG